MAKPFYFTPDALVLWSPALELVQDGHYRIDSKIFRPARLEERADAGSPVPP
jgi:hypothetical protein